MVSEISERGVAIHSPHPYSLNTAETDLVASLVQAPVDAGVRVAPSAVINLYVALKSKPLLILIGPANSGKIAAVQTVANILTGGDTARLHMLVGHAWWAGQSGNVGLFTEAQERLNAGAIIDLIREAWRPENARRVLVACLARIRPAEVAGLFSNLAFQLRHGQIMQLPGIHLTRPVPYPPNLLLIGTLDADYIESPDPDMLEMTTVIHWPGAGKAVPYPNCPTCVANESTYLHARIRTEREACLKLSHVLVQKPSSLEPLFQVENVCKQHHHNLPLWMRGAVLVYLANAWDADGHGLFDRHAARNCAIAFDLALTQIMLPHVVHAEASPELSRDLSCVLARSFPNAKAVLDKVIHK